MGGDHQTDDERQQWRAIGSKQRYFESTVRLARHRAGEVLPLPLSPFEALGWYTPDDHAAALKRLREHGERP